MCQCIAIGGPAWITWLVRPVSQMTHSSPDNRDNKQIDNFFLRFSTLQIDHSLLSLTKNRPNESGSQYYFEPLNSQIMGFKIVCQNLTPAKDISQRRNEF